MTPHDSNPPQPRVLITAGPSWEPIDEVRFLGNRSSGRLGLELARAASDRLLPTTLLLGPGVQTPPPPRATTHRFRTAQDLDEHLRVFWPKHDLLIMAAAVADYRPVRTDTGPKLPRGDQPIDLRLDPTPDLIAAIGRVDHPGTRIGFALEAADSLESRAREKLARKDLHAIVANPLGTMESDEIEGMLIPRDGPPLAPTPPRTSKAIFADWLVDRVLEIHHARIAASAS